MAFSFCSCLQVPSLRDRLWPACWNKPSRPPSVLAQQHKSKGQWVKALVCAKPADQSAAHAHTAGQNQLHKFSSDLHTSAPCTNAHRPFSQTCVCVNANMYARTHTHRKKQSRFATTRSLWYYIFFSFCHFPKIKALHCRQASRKKGEKGGNVQFSNIPSPGSVSCGFHWDCGQRLPDTLQTLWEVWLIKDMLQTPNLNTAE